MIRTVSDLRRALEAFPDDYPVDETGKVGLVLDNYRVRDSLLTLKTFRPMGWDEPKTMNDGAVRMRDLESVS